MSTISERTRSRMGGGALFSGAAMVWFVNTVAESSYPNYSVHDQALSELGSFNGPTSDVWNTGLLVLAALWAAGAYLVFRRLSTGWLILNLVPPIGAVIVAVVPSDSIPVLHNLGAALVFAAGGVAAIADGRLLDPPFKYVSMALGVTVVISLALFVTASGRVLGFGGEERLVAYPILMWLMGLGGYVMASQDGVVKRT